MPCQRFVCPNCSCSKLGAWMSFNLKDPDNIVRQYSTWLQVSPEHIQAQAAAVSTGFYKLQNSAI